MPKFEIAYFLAFVGLFAGWVLMATSSTLGMHFIALAILSGAVVAAYKAGEYRHGYSPQKEPQEKEACPNDDGS